MKRERVAIIGAGQVGATAAQRILEKDLADIVLFDIVEGMPQGKALDLMQASALEKHSGRIQGTNRYEDIQGAGIVVITAGLPRKPGMTREDLLVKNAEIVREVGQQVKRYAPNAIIIAVTNPLDSMTYLVSVVTEFPKTRVMGMAGVLDSARMKYFIAEKLKVKSWEVEAVVLGGHGDLMVPVMSQVKVKGKRISEVMSKADIDEIVKRTQDGGAEIVALLKSGSAFYAPASSVADMVQSMVRNDRREHPVCAYLSGEYGLSGIYCGVTAQLGSKGVEKVVELKLDPSERQALNASANKVHEGITELEKLGILTPSHR